MLNKKGNINLILIFFIILFLILFLGIIMVVGSSLLNWVFDVSVPELSDLGVIEDKYASVNMTQIASYTLTPLNSVIQSFTWLTGVLYVMMLAGSFAIVFIFKAAPSKWLISIYFLLAIVLIIGSIFISNIYEDFYNGTDDLSTRLKEHTLLSFMIIYSPTIFTIIVFIVGALLFSNIAQEEYI